MALLTAFPLFAVQPRLELSAVETLAVPSGLHPRQAIRLSNAYAFIANNSEGVWIRTDNIWRELCGDVKTVGLGVGATGLPELMALDGAVHSVLHNGCRSIGRFVTRDSIVGAARGATSWFVATMSSRGLSHLWDFSIDSDSARTLPTPSDWSVAATHVHLSATDKGVIVAAMWWPFAWFRVDGRARMIQGEPFAVDTTFFDGTDSVPARQLVSLGVTAIDSSFLHVLGDVRSDLRALVLYNSVGVPVRYSVLSGAIGPLSGDTGANEILLLRTTDNVDIVRLKWRWVISP